MRSLLTLLFAFGLLLVQSTLSDWASLSMPAPALGLLAAVHIGLNPAFSMPRAAFLVFVIGYLLDVISGAPRGTHALVYLLVVVLMLQLRTRVLVRTIVARSIAGLLFSALAALGVLVVRAVVLNTLDGSAFKMVPLEALFTGVVAAPVFWILERADRLVNRQRSRLAQLRSSTRELIINSRRR